MLVKAARKTIKHVPTHEDIMIMLTKKEGFTLLDQERLRKIDPGFRMTSEQWFHPLKVRSVTWHPAAASFHEHEPKEEYAKQILALWPNSVLMMAKRDKRDKHLTSVSVMAMNGDHVDVSVTPHPPAKFGSIPSDIKFHEMLTISHAKDGSGTYHRVTLGDLALTRYGPVDVTRYRHPSLTITDHEPIASLLDIPEAMPEKPRPANRPSSNHELQNAVQRVIDFLYGPYRKGWAR